MDLSNYKYILKNNQNYLLDYRILLYNFIKLVLVKKIKKKGEIVCMNNNGNINLLDFMNNKKLLTKVNKYSDVFKLNINIKNSLNISPLIVIKSIPLTYKDRENMYDPTYPVWRELKILKILTNLSKKRVLPNLPIIYNYYICNSCKYENPNLKKITDKICLLVLSEYNKYDFRTWLIHISAQNYDNSTLSNIWYNSIFQLLSTLYLLYKQFKLVHLDLHWGNILVQTHKAGGYRTYIIDGISYYIPNLGFTLKLWDFGKSKSRNIFKQDSSIPINQTHDIIRFSNIYNWIIKSTSILNKNVIPTNIINYFQEIKKNTSVDLGNIIYKTMSKYMHNKLGDSIPVNIKQNLINIDYIENLYLGEIVAYNNKYAIVQGFFKFKIYLITKKSNNSVIKIVNYKEVSKILTNIGQSDQKSPFLKDKNIGIYKI